MSARAMAGGAMPGGVSARRDALRRRLLFVVGGAAVLWLLVMLVGGSSGLLALGRARAKLLALEAEAAAVAAENDRLRTAIAALEHEDGAVERIAREELMMARPGEEVILVAEPAAGP